MTKKLMGALLALLIFAAPVLAETINGAGASFPYPAYATWAYFYDKATGNKLNYQSIGSGGGVQQIKNKTVDFGASDEPMSAAELKSLNMIQFPAIIGGVVPIINIAGLKPGELKLTGDLLARIYMGEITNWSDAAIKQLNPTIALPNAPITVVYRSDGSGTTAIFTSYLSVASKAWKTKIGEGKTVSWPVGMGGKKNDGVAQYVKQVANSIGYVEFAYAKQNKLPYAELKNKAGKFVDPSFASFKDAAATAKWDKANHFDLMLVDAPGANSWPIAGASFIILRKDQPQANTRTVQFFKWAFESGDEAAEKLDYVAIPDSLKNLIFSYLKENGVQF